MNGEFLNSQITPSFGNLQPGIKLTFAEIFKEIVEEICLTTMENQPNLQN